MSRLRRTSVACVGILLLAAAAPAAALQFKPPRPVGPTDAARTAPTAFSVTPAGEAVWTLPLWIPEGRNRIQPQLAISYRSRADNGTLGLHFALDGFSSITRCWRTIRQDGGYTPPGTAGVPDRFCWNGQKLVPRPNAPASELQPELDPSVLVRVVGPAASPQGFTLYRRDGRIESYGFRNQTPFDSSNATLRGPAIVVSAAADASGRFTTDLFTESASATPTLLAWKLARVQDHYGNYYDIDYRNVNLPGAPVEQLPWEIRWTGYAPTTAAAAAGAVAAGPTRRLAFIYRTSAKLDVRAGFQAGVAVARSRLLDKIQIFAVDGLVSDPEYAIPGSTAHVKAERLFREYRFDYLTPVAGQRSTDRLRSVTECVANAPTALQCLDPLTFTWTQAPAVPQFTAQSLTDATDIQIDNKLGVPAFAADVYDMAVGDFDGDGRDDVVYRLPVLVGGRFRDKDGADPYFTANPQGTDADSELAAPAANAVGRGDWFLRRGTGTGLGARSALTGLPSSPGGDWKFSPRVVDVDGNGTAELLLYSEPLNAIVTAPNQYQAFRLGCPGGTCDFTPIPALQQTTAFPLLQGFPRRSFSLQTGDLTGDGLVDFIHETATALQTAGDPTTLSLRAGVAPNGTSLLPGVTLRVPVPVPPSNGNIVTRLFDERFLVDTDGNGQLELLTLVDDAVPTGGMRPFTFSSLSPVAGTTVGATTVGATTLHAVDVEASDAIGALIGRNACYPPGDPLLRGLMTDPQSGTTFQAYTRLTRHFIDVNGDGLRDSVAVASGARDRCPNRTGLPARLFVSINTGAAFRPPVAIPLTVRTGFNPSMMDVSGALRSMDPGVRVADLDGDGREDFLLVSLNDGQFRATGDTSNRQTGVIWLRSTGATFVAQELGVPLSWNSFQIGSRIGTYGPRLAQTGDFNGDGLLDFVMPPVGSQNLTVSLQIPRSPDLVTKIEGGPLVPAREIAYGRASILLPDLYTRDATRCAWPQICLKSLGWVVASTTVEAADFAAPSPVRTVTAFRYENARLDSFGRGLLGVDKLVTTVRDESQPPRVFRTETQEFDLSTLVCQNAAQNRCAYADAGRPSLHRTEIPIRTNRRFVSERKVKRTLTATAGGSGYRVTADVETQTAWEVDTAAPNTRIMLRSSRDTVAFDGYGNAVSQKFETSGNELALNGTTAAGQIVHSLEQTLPQPQVPNEANWLVSRYPELQIRSIDPTLPMAEREVVRERSFTYRPDSVDLETVTVEPSRANAETPTTSGFTLITTYTRDERGSLTSVVQDGSTKTRSIRFAFDANDRDRIFPVEKTDALNHTIRTYSHAVFGAPQAIDDANGIRTELEYDALGRVSVYRPAGRAATTSLYRRDGRLLRSCDIHPAFGTVCESSDPGGRLVKRQATAFDLDTLTLFSYDRFGRLAKWSLPVQVAGPRSPEYVELDRDGLGRVTAQRRPGGFASSTAYDGLRTTYTSERNLVTVDELDARGRLVRHVSREPATATTPSRDVESTYTYGHYDRPRVLRHPILPASQAMTPASAALETAFTYDVLGRLTSVQDADSGTATRVYDAFGDLKRGVDATNTATTYQYDDIGRLKIVETLATTAYPSRVGNAYAERAERFYDGAANGLGRLDRMVSNDGVETRFEYDTAGRPSATSWTVLGATHRFSYEYDTLGQLQYLNYPSPGPRPFRIKYEYGGGGGVRDVIDVSNAAQPRTLWHQIARDAFDQSTEEQFGRTAHVKRVYDNAGQLRFVWGEFIADGEMFQQQVYKWEGDGFIRSRTDLIPGAASRETYTHDFLHRLERWNVQQNCSSTEWKYTYDDLGNLRQRSELLRGGVFPATTFDYTTATDTATPHRLKRTTTAGTSGAFTAGAAGQALTGRGNTYTWTPFGLPWRIENTGAGASETLLYDGAGARTVSQMSVGNPPSGSQAVTLDGLYEVRTFGDPPRSEVVYNVPGADGVVAQVRRTSNPDTESVEFIHRDHLGNPDAITAETTDAQGRPIGTLVERAKYEPFGERRFLWALAHPMRQRHATRASLGFTGHEPDDVFALVNMRGRLYDPAASRFLAPDPSFGGAHSEARNRFSYVRNSPVLFRDPSGFIAEPVDAPAAPEPEGDPDEWISWREATHPPQETTVWACASCSAPPLVAASDETRREVSVGEVLDGAAGIALAGNAAANYAMAAIAHGAVGAVLEFGGSASLTLHIGRGEDREEDEENFELTMLEWRMAGLEYEPLFLELGEFLFDRLLDLGVPAPQFPPGTQVLHAKGVHVPKVKASATVGQEAHRQILRYKYKNWLHEQTLELIPGVIVRKDAFRLRKGGAEVLIIKPDTPSGRAAGARRGRLMKAAGYDVKYEYYNPKDPAYKPGSSTYIRP